MDPKLLGSLGQAAVALADDAAEMNRFSNSRTASSNLDAAGDHLFDQLLGDRRSRQVPAGQPAERLEVAVPCTNDDVVGQGRNGGLLFQRIASR